MSVKCKDVIEIMNKLAPPCLTLKGDNTGLMLGDSESNIDSILISLDVNDDVCEEAAKKGCSLIINHHPFIFHPLNRIDFKSPRGRLIEKLISNGINVFSAHTNLDIAEGGINDYLAKILGLVNVEILDVTYEEPAIDVYPSDANRKYGLGRIGTLNNPMTFKDLCTKIKQLLKVDSLNVVGNPDKKVHRIALCSGSGAEFIPNAAEAGCDVYFTGDIKYHAACDARDLGLSIIDGGHFASENIYMGYLADYLRGEFEKKNYTANIYLSEKNKDPFYKV